MRGVLGILGVFVALMAPATAASSQDVPKTSDCLDCHGVEGSQPAGEAPDGTSFYLGSWENSVHSGLDCTDCHTSVSSLDHLPELPAAECTSCHEEIVDAYQGGSHGKAFGGGDELAPSCASCHDPHTDLPADDPASTLHRTNLAAVCIKCHGDEKGVGGRNNTAVPHPAQSYAQGAHAQAMQAGNEAAATCSDCHESHAVLRAQEPQSWVHQRNVSRTCGQCHVEIRQAFEASVHGRGIELSASGSPTCNSCHGEHAVVNLGEPGQTMVIANETCSSCHSRSALARRYGLPEGAVASYEDSYHGRATRGGLAQAAGCTSCHGVHHILGATDSLSSIHPNQLLQTCRNCHSQATEVFANSYAHTPRQPTKDDEVVGWVRSIYLWLIGIVIGGMLLHNFVVFLRDTRELYKHQRRHPLHPRFNRNEVVQHTVFVTAFITLVITGFALQYPDMLWSRPLAWIGINEPVRRIVHRTAGILMILSSLYHLFYLMTARGREQIKSMAPAAHDVRDFATNMSHKLGLASRGPRFRRYRYIEKAEYWAVLWGTAVMAFTGLVLWFPQQLNGPVWLVRVCETVHLYEAWLAMLAILVWHFFYVMFRPEVFPVSFTMLDGQIPLDELKHEHPGEYERLYGAGVSKPPKADPEFDS